MTINERIKLLRKELGFNQTDFGEKIGIKVSQASYIEKAGNPVTQRIVQLICTVFNISEKWLTEGQGDMYTSDEDAILDKLAGMYDLSDSQMILAKQWLQLPATAKDAVVDYIVSVASALHREKDKKMLYQKLTQRKIILMIRNFLFQRNEAHRLLAQELDAQEKAQSVSTSSQSPLLEAQT